jgi:glycosyltransferase involved in cell wall biosynthesis
MKLLGTQIANGYSPEARVFASLLGHRQEDYEALVLHHDWSGDRTSADRFEHDARARVARFDTGWRPNPDNRRSLFSKMLSYVRFRRALPAMARTAREYNPDVIYSCQQKWDCAAATYIARRLNKPQIIHLHYIIGPWLGKSALARLLTCDHVVTVSDFIRDEAIRHGVRTERVTTIRNGLAPFPPAAPGTREAVRAELGLSADASLVGIIARLDTYKGQHDTIAAFTAIAPKYPNARLAVVGSGPARTAVEAQVANSGVADRIILTGPRSDVPRILAALDVFAHPSRNDPCPLSVIEASAAGLPVVAYAEGGVSEIVLQGKTGLLAPPGDVNTLVEYLAQFLREPDLARTMGVAGKQRMAAEFRPEEASRSFSALLRQL